MSAKRNFRVVINLSNFFHDHRNRARIFISEDIKRISDLANRIENIFLIKNFHLTSQNEYLPPSEDVGILQNDEIIWVIQNGNQNGESPKNVSKKTVKETYSKRPMSPTEDTAEDLRTVIKKKKHDQSKSDKGTALSSPSKEEREKKIKNQKSPDVHVTTEKKISPTKKKEKLDIKKTKHEDATLGEETKKKKVKKVDLNISTENKTKDTSTKHKEAKKKTVDKTPNDQIATRTKGENNTSKKGEVMKINTLLPVLHSHISTYNKKISNQAGASSSANISEIASSVSKKNRKSASEKKKGEYVCKGDLSYYKKSVPIPTITDEYLKKKKINIIKVEILNNSNANKTNNMQLLHNTPNTSYSDDHNETDQDKVDERAAVHSDNHQPAQIKVAVPDDQNQQAQPVVSKESTYENLEASPTPNSHDEVVVQVATESTTNKSILPDGAASNYSDLEAKAKEYIKAKLEKEVYKALNLFSVEDIPEEYKSGETVDPIDGMMCNNFPNARLNIDKELEDMEKDYAYIETEDEKNGNEMDKAQPSDVMETSKRHTEESAEFCRPDHNTSLTSDTGVDSFPSLSTRESDGFDGDDDRSDPNNPLDDTIKPSDSSMLDITNDDEGISSKIPTYSTSMLDSTNVDDSISSKISTYSMRTRVSGVGQLLEDLRNNITMTSTENLISDCNESVTKKKRKRVRKKKSKTHTADIMSSLENSFVTKGIIVPIPPKQHLKFEDDVDGNLIAINQSSSRNSLRDSGSYVDLEDFVNNSDRDISFIDDEYISSAPLLTPPRLPTLGDLIAFKILRITENYTPDMSTHIIGTVLGYNKQSHEVVFRIMRGLDQFSEPEGRFSTGAESRNNEDRRAMDWNDIMEPRLLRD